MAHGAHEDVSVPGLDHQKHRRHRKGIKAVFSHPHSTDDGGVSPLVLSIEFNSNKRTVSIVILMVRLAISERVCFPVDREHESVLMAALLTS